MGHTPLILRPFGVIQSGRLELGLEAVFIEGRLVDLRRQTGPPDPFVLSRAFVNAHSHLEYRGMMGRIQGGSYLDWIRAITRLKLEESPEEVVAACSLAAFENRQTGVAMIGEHSDRPGSAAAMATAGLGGVIFQEVITVTERETRHAKLAAIREKLALSREHFPADLSPHAYQTVDPETLADIANGRISIHVAETDFENQLVREGSGPLAAFRRSLGYETPPTGRSMVEELDRLGLAHDHAQFVHCCAVSAADIDLMAQRGVTVAHCPRSNVALGCPVGPVRAMLAAGIAVGLGLDSAASSGPIDMFAEMRTALSLDPALTAEDVWNMATDMGARSLRVDPPDAWITIDVPFSDSLVEVLERGGPECVRWVT